VTAYHPDVAAGARLHSDLGRYGPGVPLVRFAVLTAHVLVGAIWLGAMSYSIAVVQPKLLAFAGSPQRRRRR
jgi:hypothetical protein